jgi:uncharacterized protein (DUF1501 family)
LQSAPGLPDATLPVIAGEGQPTALLGYGEAVTMGAVADFGLWDNGVSFDAQREALRRLYQGDTALLRAGRKTLEALDTVRPAAEQEYHPANGAQYGDDPFSGNLMAVAQMIKLGTGLQAAAIDLGGWDTHEYQGENGQGYFADLLGQLARGLLAFYTDLDGSGSENYTAGLSVVVISEFGRRLNENDSGGTDHGHGSVMLALGGGVNGGRVYGSWPGLETEALYDRSDLAVTTDFRRVLSELLVRRLNNPNLGAVFPGYHGFRSMGVFQYKEGVPPLEIKEVRLGGRR